MGGKRYCGRSLGKSIHRLAIWRRWLLVASVPFGGWRENRAEGRDEFPKVWLGGRGNLVVVDGNWGELQLDWSVISMLL